MNFWWKPGHIIGYEHTFVHAISDFVNATATNSEVSPDFLDGARSVAVLESATASFKSSRWEKVRTVK
jgi:predicted dehydrogenase